MMSLKHWVGWAALLLALSSLALPLAPAQAQQVNVSPDVGPPGTTFAFFATGFIAEERVTYWVTDQAGTLVSAGDVVFANEDGRADWRWTAPLDIAEGPYTMVATGSDSTRDRFIAFAIGPLPPPAVDPALAGVTPAFGAPGTTFRFYAAGFLANERVNYWLTAPDGTVRGSLEFEERANETGRVEWQWGAPGDAIGGTWLMVARGRDSQIERVIPFAIQAGLPPEAEPNISVNPDVGIPGSTFSFAATGFDDLETVFYWVNMPNGQVLSEDDYNTDADADGRAEWQWRAPDDAAPGVWQLVVRGNSSNVQYVIPFEIQPR